MCALFGLIVERFLVRPFVDRRSEAWLMATVAGGIVLDNAMLFTFGKEPRSFPSVLAVKPVALFGRRVYPLQLIIRWSGSGSRCCCISPCVTRSAARLCWRWCRNKDAARLMGINVRKTIALSFALSAVLAGLAGLLIAPLFNVNSEMGTLFGIKAFAVAILGGITSAWGVMLAGLLYGLIEALVTASLGSSYTQIVAFSVVILALPPCLTACSAARRSTRSDHDCSSQSGDTSRDRGVDRRRRRGSRSDRRNTPISCCRWWRSPRWSASASTSCWDLADRSRSGMSASMPSAPMWPRS